MADEAGLAGHLETTVTAEGLRVMLHDTEGEGMFARGSAVLNKRFSACCARWVRSSRASATSC
jgi:chemotaxis protein MotB